MKLLSINRKLSLCLFISFVFMNLSSFGQTEYFKGSGAEISPILYKSQTGPSGFVRCHTMEADSIRRAQDPRLPSLMQEELWLQNKIEEYKADAIAKGSNGKPKAIQITLPIVFHIITSGTGVTNIAANRVQAQVNQLNIDYGNLAGSSNPVAADVQITFCLAIVDPSGNVLAEPGINRITTYGAGAQSQTSMDNTIKPATIWNPDNYINIWVANLGSGLLGYAQFPSNSGLGGFNANEGPANTDGVVILYSSLGSVASPTAGAAPYNLGRTLTHELGHWLGLRHVWGDGGCTVDDYCNDTPAAASENYGCSTTNSCTGGSYPGNDMIENYMDYTDDDCMNIVTADQKTRIRTVLDVSPRRMTLASSPACSIPSSDDAGISAIVTPNGDICNATFTPVVTLRNYGGNAMSSATITYNVDGAANSTFNWSGSLASGANVNVTLPSMTTTNGAHTFNSSASNPNGQTDSNAGNNSSSTAFNVNLSNGSAVPISEGFVATTFVPTSWALENGGNSLTWVRVTNAGATPTTGNAAKMDNYSTNITGDIDGLVVKPVNLIGLSSAQLTFDVSHARYNNTYSDKLEVVVYGCGVPETVVYSKAGTTLATTANTTSAFTPTTAAEWRNETVDLSPYIGNNRLFIAFRNTSGYGNNIYLDNIDITEGGVVPVTPVASFTGTPSTLCAGQTVNFTSNSTNSPTSYSWTFTGGTPSTSTAMNPSVTYNTPGTYNVALTATNAAGSNTSTQSSYVVVNDCAAGISENQFEIGIAPNPTNGKIIISSKEIMTGYSLYDYSGRLVIESNNSFSTSFELDLSNYAEGVYHIVIQSENFIQTEKILVKK